MIYIEYIQITAIYLHQVFSTAVQQSKASKAALHQIKASNVQCIKLNRFVGKRNKTTRAVTCYIKSNRSVLQNSNQKVQHSPADHALLQIIKSMQTVGRYSKAKRVVEQHTYLVRLVKRYNKSIL